MSSDLLLNLQKFCSKKIIVIDAGYAINGDNLHRYIDVLPEHDLIVFDDSTNYVRGYSALELYKNLKSFNLKSKFLILTSNFNYFNNEIDAIIYYPFYLINGIRFLADTKTDIRSSRHFNLGFLFYHVYYVRLLFILKILEKSWLDTCLFNFFPVYSLKESQLKIFDNSVKQLNSKNLSLLEKLNHRFPNGTIADPNDKSEIGLSIDNRIYTDCYINFMIESDFDTPFITEKSIKPYFSGQIPAVLGNNKLYNHLSELGIDTMSDLINLKTEFTDHDSILDYTIEQISNLIPNLEQIWNDSYKRRLQNYYYVRSTDLINKLELTIKTAVG